MSQRAVCALAILLVAGCTHSGDRPSERARPEAATATAERSRGVVLLPRSYARRGDVLTEIQATLIDALYADEPQKRVSLADLSPGQRALYSLLATDGEVKNGGFEQFFTNSTGALIDDAIRGARRVGLRKHERILREAAGIFPNADVPEDWDLRNDVFATIPAELAEDKLSQLDERWYALDRLLDERLRSYVRANPDEFFAAG